MYRLSWSDLKIVIDARPVKINYIELTDIYLIKVTTINSENGFELHGQINKTSPRNSDQIDFEDNGYKARGNPVPIRKDFVFTTTQTNTPIWTPISGKKFIVTDIIIHVRNNTLQAQTMVIFDNTNANGNFLYRTQMESSTADDKISNYKTPFVSGAINNILKITTSGNIIIHGTIHGYEL